jgi:hypothetical protein
MELQWRCDEVITTLSQTKTKPEFGIIGIRHPRPQLFTQLKICTEVSEAIGHFHPRAMGIQY